MTVRLLSATDPILHSDACSFEHGSNLLQAFREGGSKTSATSPILSAFDTQEYDTVRASPSASCFYQNATVALITSSVSL